MCGVFLKIGVFCEIGGGVWDVGGGGGGGRVFSIFFN